MTTHKFILVILGFVLAFPNIVSAQQNQEEKEDKPVFPLDDFYAKRKPNTTRNILKNFSLGLSSGYGHTFFRHKLDGFGVFQVGGYPPSIFSSGNTTARLSNWVNNVEADTVTSIIPRSLFMASSDSVELGFRGKAFNIPLKATLHYEYDRYRIGGGYSYEYMNMREFHSISYQDYIGDFRPTSPSGLMKKYFGMVGISFLRKNDLLFTADANVGGYKPGKNFNSSLIKKGIYVNIGVTIEREFSEYLKAFIRPSFEIKNYKLTIPEAGQTINHSINAFYLNIGVSFKLPSLAKCYNKDCHVQMNHVHGDTEYRSQMHPIYKKQNPMYGENHPTLIKYKRKNRKSLSPY
ncbi:MAG: hypothetical protein AABY93_10630 [Bacteroidota bacterium]